MGASVPVLAPSNVQEVLDFGIYGWAMSRFSGCWVALKAITDNMDAAMGVEIDPARYSIILPPKEAISPDGMHARWPDPPLDQEKRLNLYKIYAARLFANINGLNRLVMDSVKPTLGIITSGKAYLDVLEALDSLGIDDQIANERFRGHWTHIRKFEAPNHIDTQSLQGINLGPQAHQSCRRF